MPRHLLLFHKITSIISPGLPYCSISSTSLPVVQKPICLRSIPQSISHPLGSQIHLYTVVISTGFLVRSNFRTRKIFQSYANDGYVTGTDRKWACSQLSGNLEAQLERKHKTRDKAFIPKDEVTYFWNAKHSERLGRWYWEIPSALFLWKPCTWHEVALAPTLLAVICHEPSVFSTAINIHITAHQPAFSVFPTPSWHVCAGQGHVSSNIPIVFYFERLPRGVWSHPGK